MQFGFVALGYAAVFVFAAAALFRRHLLELQDSAAFSGGMAAAGDSMLDLFIGFLFLIPTVFLIRIIAKMEAVYAAFSKFLFGLSLSAPVCMTVVLLGDRVPQSLGWICGWRMLESPIIFVGMDIGRFAARFDRAKRLISYALLVEALTLVLPIAAFIAAAFMQGEHRGSWPATSWSTRRSNPGPCGTRASCFAASESSGLRRGRAAVSTALSPAAGR